MIIAVDLGNFNIKTSEEVIFSSRFEVGGDNAPVGEEILEYDGAYYTMEKGDFQNEFNKSKKNYLPNLLYALGKSTTVADKAVDLVLGVPLDNLAIKDVFKAELSGKTFKFKINDSDREITINKMAIIGEGMSSFYTLSKPNREKDTLIIDIGGRTVNVVSFINGKSEHKFTIARGMIELYDNIKKGLNAGGNNYTVTEVDRLLRTGTLGNIDSTLNVESIKQQFVKSIINDVILTVKPDTYSVWFTGGGTLELEDKLIEVLPNANILPDALFSNAKGNKKVAQLKWGK